MAEGVDRRAARTRKALHDALIALILRNGYEAITVQDIIDEADVGRSTFYAHYTGKEDLLRSGFRELRTVLTQAAMRAPGGKTLGFSLALFEHACAHKQIYRALVGRRGAVIIGTEFRRVLSELVRKDVSALGDVLIPKEVAVQFVVGTFLTVLTWCLERSPKLSPPEIDAIFRRLAIAGLATPRTAGADHAGVGDARTKAA
jgi:AcrR family transcriptional regulator